METAVEAVYGVACKADVTRDNGIPHVCWCMSPLLYFPSNSANALGITAEDEPTAWPPDSHMQDSEEVLDFGLA